MEKVLHQDECAPDALAYFKKSLTETTGYTLREFYSLGDYLDTEMGFEIRLDGWMLTWACDDPFYKLFKES